MSESVKKRVRPTWGMVRSLESELSELRERYRQQSLELGNARDELRVLRDDKSSNYSSVVAGLRKDVKDLRKSLELRDMEKAADDELLEKKRKQIHDLSVSECKLREQYSSLQKQLEAMTEDNVNLRVENARLVNRSFLDRLFNR